MTGHSDIIVIGGGLAGCFAAIAAAKRGASVRLLAKGASTLRQASGLIDVLGYRSSSSNTPLITPFEGFPELSDNHPYSIIGEQAVTSALSLFDTLFDDIYRGQHTERNALIPTASGKIKPTARYPVTMATGVVGAAHKTAIIGFESLPVYDGPTVATHLEDAGLPGRFSGHQVSIFNELPTDSVVTYLADKLDTNEPIGGIPARDLIVDTVSSKLGDVERVGLPAILGQDYHLDVHSYLESALGIPVFEIPLPPPSLPGYRLERKIYAELDELGVLFESGNTVVDHESTSNRISTVYVNRHGSKIPYSAEQFILATGSIVGKGIITGRDTVREPIFDCHVPIPSDRTKWYKDRFFGRHAFASFGVSPDHSLRPQNAAEQPEFDNLRAAGGVLGGATVHKELSASGISLSTGFVAGREAARGN